jgi:hypothetical protein
MSGSWTWAFALTMLFNQSAVPTSTIQILVFTVMRFRS